MAKGSSYPEDTTIIGGDFVIGIDTTAVATKKMKISTLSAFVIGAIYPVGAIYTSTANTNPATLFGFGTWSAFGAGRVMVGAGTSDVAYAAGATGGESNHQLSQAEMPSHSHGVGDPGHSHGTNPGGNSFVMTSPGGTTNRVATSGSGQQVQFGGTAGSGTGVYLGNAGGDTPHNNMPPYVVVYMFQRTA